MLSAGKPLRILIVSQFYYPDVTACAFRIKETADWLARHNCEVHVIAGEPHKGRLNNHDTDDGAIDVSRVKLAECRGQGKWNYIKHYLSFMVGAIRHVGFHSGKFDVVWASSPPLFTAISGYIIAKLKNSAFCLDIRDIWPESAVVAGQISDSGILFKATKLAEKALYKLADQITCVANPMADYIAKTGRVKRPEVIYNAILSSMLGQEPSTDRNKFEKLNVLYIGNMGYCQNLRLVIEAAEILKKQGCDDITFQLVGNGVEKPLLEQLQKERQLDMVKISGLVSKSEAIELIQSSQALMLHLKDDGIMDKTIPSKVFDYMAGANPILYGLKGEAATILQQSGGNLYFDPASPEELASQALILKKNYLHYARNARKNRELVKKKFLREQMAQKLLNIFSRLSSSSR